MELAKDLCLSVRKNHDCDKVIALLGNPNVGKSTVFNQLTGLRQHTGNWSGKTVANASGYCKYGPDSFILVDLPGCYSLIAHSAEEEVARDFILFNNPDAAIVVCDATCLERNLNLVLQTIEITSRVVVCVNLMDEAEKKKIKIDLAGLSNELGVPVVGCAARSKMGLGKLMDEVEAVTLEENPPNTIKIRYPDYIEDSILILEPIVKKTYGEKVSARRASLSLLGSDSGAFICCDVDADAQNDAVILAEEIKKGLLQKGITERQIEGDIVSALVQTAEDVAQNVVCYENEAYKTKDLAIDRFLTGKLTAFPIMILALLGVFWLTITGANYPSQLLSSFFFYLEEKFLEFFIRINAPKAFYEPLVLGVYRVLAWVVSVMLPPMAIFFPLFTLLEDAGFLPRIAFNLDKYFKKCHTCGKQALTMCMVNNMLYSRI